MESCNIKLWRSLGTMRPETMRPRQQKLQILKWKIDAKMWK